MDLYSILACPTCKVSVQRKGDSLICPRCGRVYPIVNGVPVLLPDGSIPSTEYQHDLKFRPTYDPWIHRVVMQSLPASAIILDMGAGNLTLDLSNVIRMDVTLTPYVDVVGDAHMLPFLPGTFDFVFSLAVIEHLRQPFEAAKETYDALRNGGYVYGECNFVFAYHGYPHHYFNASQQGLEQVFGPFQKLRSGVAPYQMPSAAIEMVLNTYLLSMSPNQDPGVSAFRLFLREILGQPLGTYDQWFTEEGALNVAAGVYFFGRKSLSGPSEVIPPVVQATWEREPEMRSRFPELFDIGTVPNVMLWAKGEGREQFAAIDQHFESLTPFRKNSTVDDNGQWHFDALPIVPPNFGYIAGPEPAESVLVGDAGLRNRLETVAARNVVLEEAIIERTAYIEHLEPYIAEKLAYIEMLESLIEARDEHIQALESRMAQVESRSLAGRLRSLRRR